ncbi:unnamed protein product [Symbiodinium natans]|uniref:Uncharacterized protein n=1 Tax=Symbiodinium natans TaxID=878477 RepID=A0A812PSF8_9DINO|nr:unnamed protein product [Symbiodinium natans]
MRDTTTDTIIWSRAEEADATLTEEAEFPLPLGGDAPQDAVEVEIEVEDEQDEDQSQPVAAVELPVEDVPAAPRVTFNTDIEVVPISSTRRTDSLLEIIPHEKEIEDTGGEVPRSHAAGT